MLKMSYVNIRDRKLPGFVHYLLELLAFRHFCANLVASDLRARFRRSYFGVLWAIIQPLAFSLLIALVWSNIFQSKTYWEFALYVFSGMIVWEMFVNTVLLSQEALLGGAGYLKQTRAPFLVFQLRQPLTSSIILMFGVAGFVALMLALGQMPPPGLHLLLLPAFLVMYLLFAIPISIIMSIVGTLYRDARHVSMIAVQALFFISPIMLEREILDKPGLEAFQYANPMVAILDLFRAPMLYGEYWNSESLGVYAAWTAGLWIAALIVSARTGRNLIFAL